MDKIRRLQEIDGFQAKFSNDQKQYRTELQLYFPIKEKVKPHNVKIQINNPELLPEEAIDRAISALTRFKEAYNKEIVRLRQTAIDDFIDSSGPHNYAMKSTP